MKFKTLFGSIKTQDKIIGIVGKTIKMIDWDVKYLSIKQKKNILSTNFIILPNVFLKPNKGSSQHLKNHYTFCFVNLISSMFTLY